MIHYIEVDVHGQIKNNGVADVPDLNVVRKCLPQSILHEVAAPVDSNMFYWGGGTFIPLPQAPDPHHQWDWSKKVWVDVTPEVRREQVLALVSKARQKAYPSIEDQLDALWKELGSGVKTPEARLMVTLITDVKLNNPKPN